MYTANVNVGGQDYNENLVVSNSLKLHFQMHKRKNAPPKNRWGVSISTWSILIDQHLNNLIFHSAIHSDDVKLSSIE